MQVRKILKNKTHNYFYNRSRAVLSAKNFEGFVFSQAVIKKGREGQAAEERDDRPPGSTLDQPLLVVPQDDKADG